MSTALRDRRLTLINWFSIADTVLLVILLIVAYVFHYRPGVRVIGMLHGLGFIALVLLAAEGALRRWWGWWFPAVIVVSLGPIGSFLGERHLRRRFTGATSQG